MINEWLKEFKAGWMAKDIERVMKLFVDNVEYWETPFKKLDGKDSLIDEWRAIEAQTNIDLNLSVYSTDHHKHTVIWSLSYVDTEAVTQSWAGTYLIELNGDGKCAFFYQVGEQRG